MSIGAFKDVIATGASGRISAQSHADRLDTTSERLGGKRIGAVKDFFARFTSSGRAEQKRENQIVNDRFLRALEGTYGKSKVPPELAARLRGKPEPHQPGVSGKLASSKPLSTSEVKKIITKLESQQEVKMTVTLPGTGKHIALSPQTFPLTTLTTVSNLKPQIQDKIDRGHDLVQALMNGTRGTDPAATVQDVTDIAWFLHISAEAKIDSQFKAGALTTVDSDQRLRQFLDSCPESYQRISSHIEGFKQSDGGQHRGIDIPKGHGVDSLLPHGRTTMLYASMIPNANTPMPESMLFMKLESHGCRLATPKAQDRDSGHQDRAIRLGHDIKNFLGHTFSFLSGIHARSSGNHGTESRKERIPGEIKNAFKELVENAPPGLRDTLLRNNPTGTAGGIRVMLANIAEARRLQGENRAQDGMFDVNLDTGVETPVLDPTLHDGINFDAETMVEKLIEMSYGTGPELTYRIGNEVILLPGDLG